MTEKLPFKLSSVVLISVDSFIFFPKKLLSDTEKPMVPPSDPKPAPTDIAPVGFYFTSISIVFVLTPSPSFTSTFTFPNIFKLLKLLIDFAFNNSL